MFGILRQFLEDPKTVGIFLLLALPGRLLAISAHESAHAYVANRCGDPTGRLMGRISLNPMRHLDPIGILMMLTVGIGWAKPVPVNPLNYRHYRRDDLLVSIAGVTMNFILFIASSLAIMLIAGLALARIETVSSYFAANVKGLEIFTMNGNLYWLEGDQYWYCSIGSAIGNAAYMGEYLIQPVLGSTVSYLYQMLGYSMVCNLCLMLFNLLPVPPLDGYHVLNDLVLKKPLFTSRQAMMTGQSILILLAFTGYLSKGLTFVTDHIFDWVGAGAVYLYGLIGVL